MQKQFEVAGPVELDIRLVSGEIEVDPTLEGRVEIELIGHDEESAAIVEEARVDALHPGLRAEKDRPDRRKGNHEELHLQTDAEHQQGNRNQRDRRDRPQEFE